MPAHATAATGTLLTDAVGSGQFEAASHTWSHCNLAALDREARAREIERGRTWIAAHVERPVPALALPYGLGAAHAPEASHEDCQAVLLIEGGWATPGEGFQVLPRFNVPRGLSPAGLRLRLAGFLS
jgi:peptidoglycan/xylan/chitin deacetylase (PgdA/CDA1 family)